MSEAQLIYSGVFLLGVLISSFSQVLLKRSAEHTYDSFIKEYLNPKVIVAYLLFFSATFCSVIAYKVIPLSLGPLLESVGYIFVTIWGWMFFRERVNRKKLFGLVLILTGIAIYSLVG